MKMTKYLTILSCLLASTTAYAQNVFNANFEAGIAPWAIERPAGYEHGSITIQNENVYQGQNALRLTATQPKSLVRLVSPRIELTDARNLTFKGWYRLQGQNNVLELRIRSLDAQGTYMMPWQDYFQFSRLKPTDKWSEFTLPLSIHADARFIDITLTYSGEPGEAYFDDLALTPLFPIQTPSTGYLLAGTDSPQGAFSAESPLKKIYPDSQRPTAERRTLAIAAAKGESEATQLVLWPNVPLENLKVEFQELNGPQKLPQDVFQARHVATVDIKKPASQGRSGLIPDPLLPHAPARLTAQQPHSVWINLNVPRDARAGIYQSHVVVSAQGMAPVSIPLEVRVYNFTLPEKPSFQTLARIWNFPIEGQSGPPEARQAFRENLRQHRISGEQTIADIPIKVSASGEVAIDWTQWDIEAERYFSQYGLTVFNVPHVYLGNWSGFSNKTKDGLWFGLKIGSPEWRKGFGSYVKQVADHLRAKGVLKYALWQIWDEPAEAHHETIRLVADFIHEQASDARVYVVTHLQPGLFGAVDVWCVPESMYDKKLAAERIAAGDEIWIYENFLYLIDVDITPFKLRSYPWTLHRQNITGLEWWAITHWAKDPYINTSQGTLANGNGFLLYPNHEDKNEPISSIRWEAYRDGMDDHDYLTILASRWDEVRAKANNNAALPTGCEITATFSNKLFVSDFVPHIDVEQLSEARREVAQTIEQLAAKPETIGQMAERLMKK